MIDAAPLHVDLADGPTGGRAFWLRAADGIRLRAAHWPGGDKGTVLLFPGRTEYVEKYGRAANDLAMRGYGTLTIDWRGQGLSDRALGDPMTGHVDDFAEFQHDVDALTALANALDLPHPWYLISHSMGGCIALRSLTRGLPVRAAAFSAPMWGLMMAAAIRPFASLVAGAARLIGQAHRYAPGTTDKTYVAEAAYAGNVLTTDADMFAWMKMQITTHPELSLGGPSLAWVHAALAECAALSLLPAPPIPAICALGTAEKVVDSGPVHLRMAGWPGGRLDLYPGAEHEVIMETPDHRKRFFDTVTTLFDTHR
ncbi:MAG: alpha/beta hydrolase [Paracoccaceae bacterium]|nr:alpha/beta hydrolase [Paracoccaceae bacterium]